MNLLLDPKEFRMLEGVRLSPRKSFSGRVRGERLTQRKGVSIEFADYREYSEGDDLRHLDWNVLARLDSPVMRTYRDEEDLAVHLLLDGSPSMSFGEPSKAEAARRFALALGYVGLNGGDTVYPRAVGPHVGRSVGLRGRVAFPRLAAWSEIPASERSGLSNSLRAFAGSAARPGLVILVSDGLDPEIGSALRILGGRGHEVLFLQVLSPIELDPDLEGDLRLVDAESGAPVEITANSSALRQYRERLAAHNAAIVESVLRIGGRHHLVTCEWDLPRVVQSVWKREGWVR